jgi:hypothetical protein
MSYQAFASARQAFVGGWRGSRFGSRLPPGEVVRMKAIARKRAARDRSGQIVIAVVAILLLLVIFLPALLG